MVISLLRSIRRAGWTGVLQPRSAREGRDNRVVAGDTSAGESPRRGWRRGRSYRDDVMSRMGALSAMTLRLADGLEGSDDDVGHGLSLGIHEQMGTV
jgi:hypothetical protein